MTQALVKYETLRRDIASLGTIEEAKQYHDQAAAIEEYAKLSNDKRLEAEAVVARLRSKRRLGELLQVQKKNGGLNKGAAAGGKKDAPRGTYVEPRDNTPTLSDMGLDKKLSSQAQRLAAVPEAEFEAALADTHANVLARGDIKHHRAQGTGENEWFTPLEYIALARRVLGDIDLDPASHATAQEDIRAKRYFTVTDDGLTRKWQGRVWLNPPYAQPDIAYFASKMVSELEAGHITAAVMLTHNYTDTAWFHELTAAADAICFTRGRIRFQGLDGTLASPTQGQAFFYFGNEQIRFASVFGSIGFVMRRL